MMNFVRFIFNQFFRYFNMQVLPPLCLVPSKYKENFFLFIRKKKTFKKQDDTFYKHSKDIHEHTLFFLLPRDIGKKSDNYQTFKEHIFSVCQSVYKIILYIN